MHLILWVGGMNFQVMYSLAADLFLKKSLKTGINIKCKAFSES